MGEKKTDKETQITQKLKAIGKLQKNILIITLPLVVMAQRKMRKSAWSGLEEETMWQLSSV